MVSVLGWIVLGLVAGVIARALLPRFAPGGIVLTALLGIMGALVGGLIGRLLGFGEIDRFFDAKTWLLAVAGAAIVFVVFGLVSGRRRAFAGRRRLV
jgi:uncharacterized membrane protein YeaQ/YmgE (transglycosylase-associated protein family)